MSKPSVMVIGTSHISLRSIAAARAAILRRRPACVAVELCPARYRALVRPAKPRVSELGLTVWLLSVLQRKLGRATGVLPGSEMLAAIEAGRKVGARLVLIDASIYQIIARIRAIPLSRKLSMLLRLFAGLLFTRAVTDLKETPSERLIRQVLRHMRSAMPDFYKILVADRNAYMGRWIARLAREHGSVVAVVGAGHVPGLKRILKRKGLIK